MTAFNDLNGVPCTANEFLLKDVLRKEWKYDGMVVSDWNSTAEMLAHGYAEDGKDVALKSATAGLDMEMTSTSYADHLQKLIEEKRFSVSALDELVKNVLRIKFRTGVFTNPYFKGREKFKILESNSLALAHEAAIKSSVLLKNSNHILPIKTSSQLAVIGPLAVRQRAIGNLDF